ncbi:MAG: transposase [Actinobacteria bacterium]|nr:transposase [Actinomycetota bacterium]
MGRALRVFEPGAYYHLASRGNNGQSIFHDDLDCLDFLRWLSRTVVQQEWRVVTYCLMTNHYHLLVRPGEAGFGAGMQLLNSGHARRMNRRHGRTGHLFRNHYSWWPVERDSHLLEAARYIVLNPVRAGICKRPEQWRWSSYRATVDLEHPLDFFAASQLLALFGARPGKARAAFRDFVAAGHVSVSDTET